MSGCLISGLQLQGTWPWFGLVIKSNEIQCGSPITGKVRTPAERGLVRLWVIVRILDPVGIWKAWHVVVVAKEGRVNEENSLRVLDSWASPSTVRTLTRWPV